MGYVILKKYVDVSGYVSQVSSIADKNKTAFGFLSTSVYEQMALKGQLWVAINTEKELKGYLMFGGTMPALKVFQIYSCKSIAGQGIGTRLVKALIDHARNGHYHTIQAKVASDLPANRFWEKRGFTVYRQVPGRGKKERKINIRGYSLEDNHLFGGISNQVGGLTPSRPMLDRPLYVLDLNLLLDVVKHRHDYQKVIKLMRSSFQGGLSICVTPEFKTELERQSDNFGDDPVLRLAEAFPELKTKENVSKITASLRDVVFPDRSPTRKSAQNDESDLLHLAYCISTRVQGFITRDKALLRASDKIKDKYGVSILAPDELILDDGDMLDISNPINSDFSFGRAVIGIEIREFLENFSAPDQIIRKIFTSSPVNDDITVYEARLDDLLFGIYFFQKPLKTDRSAAACLYVDESCPKAMAAIDHFLENALRYKSGFLYRLDLHIGRDQGLTEDTLRRKGFFKSEDRFVKIICNLFLDKNNWNRFAKDIRTICGLIIPDKLPTKKELLHTGIYVTDAQSRVKVLSWFEFETIISPRFILNSDRTCILVPIRENYANGLIGNITNQLSLLSSYDKALLLEKAYFRSSPKASLFKKGEVVAFYVSGPASIQEIVGLARITYSDVVKIDEAIVKVDRQGVLSHDELSELTDKSDRLHVFTFDNFLEFDCRITFLKAKKLGLISNANLISPEKIESDKLKILIGEAFSE